MTARGHESSEGDRVTANGHDDLPDEQGIASAVDAVGSGPKAATGHVESGLSETGSDPRIVTGLPESESEHDASGSGPKTETDHVATARERTAIEMSPASDALDRLTASSKQSENDGNCHESCPTKSGLCDPSLFLDPKIGKHRRIENGSGPQKTLPTHHVAERAVISGERQPRKRRGHGASAANEQPPPPQLPKGLRRQRHTRAHQTSDQRHFHPSCSTEVEQEERKPHGAQHQVHPKTPPPPLLACPPEGREEEEVPGCMTSEEVRARGEIFSAGRTKPEGRERFRSA